MAVLDISPPSDWETETPKAPARVNLDGSGSYDPDVKVPVGWRPSCRDDCSPRYKWKFEVHGPSGYQRTEKGEARYPSALSIGGPYATAHTRVKLPKEGLYTVVLTVYDPKGAQATARMDYVVYGDREEDECAGNLLPVALWDATPPYDGQSPKGDDTNGDGTPDVYFTPITVHFDAERSYDIDSPEEKLTFNWHVRENVDTAPRMRSIFEYDIQGKTATVRFGPNVYEAMVWLTVSDECAASQGDPWSPALPLGTRSTGDVGHLPGD